MTIYTGEASTKQKLKGIAEGVVASITQRIPEGTVLEGLPKFASFLKDTFTDLCDKSEEGAVDPKIQVEAVHNIRAAMEELLGTTPLAEPKTVILCIRNLVAEAFALGKGK